MQRGGFTCGSNHQSASDTENASAAFTCEHQFPFVQQAAVRNEVLQRDRLQEVFETLKEKLSVRHEENSSPFDSQA